MGSVPQSTDLGIHGTQNKEKLLYFLVYSMCALGQLVKMMILIINVKI